MASSSCEQSTYHSEPKVTSPLEPEASQPPEFHSSTEYPQLPRVKITEIEQWLGVPLSRPEQLHALNPHLTSTQRHLWKCSAAWSKFNAIQVPDWPEPHTYTDNLSIYMLNGKIEVVFINSFNSTDKNQHKTLQKLNKFITNECKPLSVEKHFVGYQCPTFALSSLSNFRPFPISLKQLKAPHLPLNLNKDCGDGCYGSALMLYKDKDVLTHFLDFIRQTESLREWYEMGPTSGQDKRPTQTQQKLINSQGINLNALEFCVP